MVIFQSPRLAIYLFCLLFFIPGVYADLDDSNLSAQESKIILKIERFSNLPGGIETIWNLVKKVASNQGLKVKESRGFPGEERTRFLSYLDTQDFKLYKSGYILRRRQKQKKGDVQVGMGNGKTPKYELVLKFRSRDLREGVIPNVRSSGSFDGETTIERDVVVGPKEINRFYSISTKVKLKRAIGTTVSDFAEIFPGLPNIGFTGKERLDHVNDVVVREYTVSPGEVFLDPDNSVEVTFSVWYLNKEEKPSIVEFSYKQWFSPKSSKGEKVTRPSEISDRLLIGIQSAIRDWIAESGTKSGLIYKIQASDQE